MSAGMYGSRGQVVATFAQAKRVYLEDLCAEISGACTLTKADIVGCITALAEAIAKHVGRGHTVDVGELGTFSASLRVAEDVTDKTAGQKIRVSKVCFRASSLLKRKAEQALERCGVGKAVVHAKAVQSTVEERLAVLQDYLKAHQSISIRNYAALVGLSRYRAGLELRRWQAMAGSGVRTAGRGTHRVTVWTG